jgi:hypothetical protein
MLITTIAQLRAASSINVSNNIDNWLPYIADAQEMFIVPIIGEALYDQIIMYLYSLEADNRPSEDGASEPPIIKPPPRDFIFDELILKLRKATGLYALFLGVDEMAVSISSAGVQVLQSDTHKSAPQYQLMNLKETYLTRAHRQIDLILKFIAKNADSFSDYPVPPNPYFIRNADEFQVHADIHSSRRVFLSLMPVIGSIEQKYIKPTLSPDYFDALKINFQSGGLNEEDQPIIDLLIPALVHLTMARALLEISIDTLDWGIFNSAANTFNNLQNKTQANQERISAMHDANQRDGEAELKMLQEFLDNNASSDRYAMYFNSIRFVGKETAVKRGEFLNTSTNSIFVA